eukprot:735164-Prorocentrum_lima.AAC.1
MTSSLVGSEMCIRDRRKDVMSAGNFPTATLEAASSKAWPGSDTMAMATPVSYTHLTLPTICSV